MKEYVSGKKIKLGHVVQDAIQIICQRDQAQILTLIMNKIY